jgi:hypothetical protein
MKKIRLIISILKTNNFILITDDISDGFVLPHVAHEYLALLEPISEHLKQLGREYTRGSK